MIQLNNKQFRQTGGYSQGLRIPSVSSAPGASILKDDTMKSIKRIIVVLAYAFTYKMMYFWMNARLYLGDTLKNSGIEEPDLSIRFLSKGNDHYERASLIDVLVGENKGAVMFKTIDKIVTHNSSEGGE